MKILAFGEVMMRLMPPNYKLLSQGNTLEFLYTGTGVNVLSGLYQMGHEVFMATTLPDNSVGYAASGELRKLGISDKHIGYKGEHMGMYFLEVGVGKRPSKVTYMNRREGSFGKSKIEDYNISKILEGVCAIHICGISLALNKYTRECAFRISEEAREKGVKVIFDCNFRPSLWSEEERKYAKEEYEKMLSLADIVFAGEKDGELLLEIEAPENLKGTEKTHYLLERMRKKYNINTIFGTLRNNEGENQTLQGYMVNEEGMNLSRVYDLVVYDRVGAGDGFASGAIHGYLTNMSVKDNVEFATASGVLAHTTYGDSPVLGILDIERVMNGKYVDLIR